MMKKTIILSSLLAAALLLLQACYGDTGNYDYRDVNEISIRPIDNREYFLGDELEVRPVITSTLAESEADYTYSWRAVSANMRIQEFATTRNLKITISGDNFPIDNYQIVLRVTDKATGVYSEAGFSMSVKNIATQGFLVMSERTDQTMQMDMYSWYKSAGEESARYHFHPNILEAMDSGLPTQTGPIKMVRFERKSLSGGYALYLLTRTGANRLHNTTLKYIPEYNVRYDFSPPSLCPDPDGEGPLSFVAENLVSAAFSALLYGKDLDDKYHLYNYDQVLCMWGPPLNVMGGQEFTPSPHFAGIMHRYVVFDEDKKAFYQLHRMDCTKLPAKETDLLKFDNTQRDLVHLSFYELNSTMRYYYAVMKDADSRYWLFRFNSDHNDYRQDKLQEMTGATHIATAEHIIVGGSEMSYIYYSVGGTVYEYDLDRNEEYTIINEGANTITYLGFPDSRSHLYVGSYTGTAGRLKRYQVTGLHQPFPEVGESEWLTQSGNTFGKITDVFRKPN